MEKTPLKDEKVVKKILSRGGGIRTPGASQHNGFQDRRIRPLCHASFNELKILV